MKHIFPTLFLGGLLVALMGACQEPEVEKTSPPSSKFEQSETVTQDSVRPTPDFTIDYDSYLRWRDMAKVLFDSGDPKAYSLYTKLVSYMEQYNRKDPAFDSEAMTEDLKASFATIDHPTTQHKIDSLLYYHAYPTLYNPSYQTLSN